MTINEQHQTATDALPNAGCCAHWTGRHDPDDGSCDHCACVNPTLIERESQAENGDVEEWVDLDITYPEPKDVEILPVVSEAGVLATLREHGIGAFNGSQVACSRCRTWMKTDDYHQHLAELICSPAVIQ